MTRDTRGGYRGESPAATVPPPPPTPSETIRPVRDRATPHTYDRTEAEVHPPRDPHTGCAFCAILADEAPATILGYSDEALVIAPLNPVTPGHVIAIDREHTPDAGADASRGMWVAWAALAWANRQRSVGEYPAYNIITSAGAEATQTVFHTHVHVVPRRADDGLPLPWTPQQANLATFEREATSHLSSRGRVHPGPVDGCASADCRPDGSHL